MRSHAQEIINYGEERRKNAALAKEIASLKKQLEQTTLERDAIAAERDASSTYKISTEKKLKDLSDWILRRNYAIDTPQKNFDLGAGISASMNALDYTICENHRRSIRLSKLGFEICEEMHFGKSINAEKFYDFWLLRFSSIIREKYNEFCKHRLESKPFETTIPITEIMAIDTAKNEHSQRIISEAWELWTAGRKTYLSDERIFVDARWFCDKKDDDHTMKGFQIICLNKILLGMKINEQQKIIAPEADLRLQISNEESNAFEQLLFIFELEHTAAIESDHRQIIAQIEEDQYQDEISPERFNLLTQILLEKERLIRDADLSDLISEEAACFAIVSDQFGQEKHAIQEEARSLEVVSKLPIEALIARAGDLLRAIEAGEKSIDDSLAEINEITDELVRLGKILEEQNVKLDYLAEITQIREQVRTKISEKWYDKIGTSSPIYIGGTVPGGVPIVGGIGLGAVFSNPTGHRMEIRAVASAPLPVGGRRPGNGKGAAGDPYINGWVDRQGWGFQIGVRIPI